jgi:MiaB-like tRNA modifying enzyme
MSKVYIETYGCTMNRGDTEIMIGYLGDRYTPRIEEADIVIVNTCGVKIQTERKNLRRIRDLCRTKKVIVAGCIPKIVPEKIDSRVSGILDPQSIHKIREVVENVENGKKITVFSENVDKSFFKKKREGITAIIPISEGCLGSCTYCCVKNARGNLLSFEFDNLLREAGDAVNNGYKQIFLTSQDTGCYGFDADRRLPELLKSMTTIDGKFKIRVGMMNPTYALTILDDLVEVYKSEKIYAFLHLPVQSGDNGILEKMKRQYTVEDFMDIVRIFRRNIPHLHLSTDIIVGFPGEGEEEFSRTVELIKNVNPDTINVTRYSVRPNTEAAQMEQVYGWTKKERSRMLHDLRMTISQERNKRYVGKKYEVLVTNKGDPHMIGRMGNYTSVVVNGTIGEFKKVTITEARANYLMAV